MTIKKNIDGQLSSPWGDIYKEAHKDARDDYLNSIKSIRRVDEKTNKYLVILSIALVASITIFAYFLQAKDIKTSLLILIYLPLFMILFIFTIFSIVKCVQALNYTEVMTTLSITLIKDYYKKRRSLKKEIDTESYHSYLFIAYNTACKKNREIEGKKRNHLKDLTFCMSIAFIFLLYIIFSLILNKIFTG